MDKIERRRLTQEVGLELGYRFFKFAAGSEFLHYGRFESDIPADFQHIKQAQERYLERLMDVIPAHVGSILDVGAGSGKNAEVLIERGFEVDCVSPGQMLGDLVVGRLGSRSTLYRGRFEDVIIPKRYDLVLFSESFQYIPYDTAITKARSVLNPGGHILVCDFFRRPESGESGVGGGHAWQDWKQYYEAAPLDLVFEQEITAETAPTIDILNDFNQQVLKPAYDSGLVVAGARWPLAKKVVQYLFRRDLAKLERKRFSNRATGAEFARAKIYMLHLFKARAD